MKSKVTIIFLAVLIVSLTFPQMLPAKSAQFTYWALGTTELGHTYNDIPFSVSGRNLVVQKPPPGQGDGIFETSSYLPSLSFYRAYQVHFLQSSRWSAEIPDGTVMGRIRVCYRDGTCEVPVDLFIGVNTADWAYDRPELQPILAHTKIPPAYSYWTNTDSYDWYWGHYFYTSVDTDPAKILDHIDLILDEVTRETYEYLGVHICAVTLETTDVPPVVEGVGILPNEENSGNCAFVLNVKWKEGEAWPTGSLAFIDPDTGLIFQAEDFLNFGVSRPLTGEIFHTGFGRIYDQGNYRFRMWLKEGGIPGAGNDYFRLMLMDKETGEIYYEIDQYLTGGNITVKTK